MREIMYNLAIVQNQPAIYTYARVYESQIDFSLYKYDIIASDDGFDPIAIRDEVLVNHWGSLICKEPLIVDIDGWFNIKDRNDFEEYPNISINIEKFMSLNDDEFFQLINDHKEDLYYDEYLLF